MTASRANRRSCRQGEATRQALMDAIPRLTSELGYPPSLEELGAAVGLVSPSTVHRHLRILEEEKRIARGRLTPRSVRVL